MDIKTIFLMASLFFNFQTPSHVVSGIGTAVHSGDTFTILSENELYKIRLADVDAPELKQSFGRQAQNFTYDRVYDRKVEITIEQIDANGLFIGKVVLDNGRTLNEELLASGLAWHYRVKHQPSQKLTKLEYFAYSNHIGLWMQPNPLPPWEFRKETSIPEAPVSPNKVDYNQIFHYGIVANKKTKQYQWPACLNYKPFSQKQAIIFSNMLEAERAGYIPAKGCP